MRRRTPNRTSARGMQKVRALTVEEIRRLLEACREDEGWRGRRDELLMALLALRGLRVHEALSLTVPDVVARDGTVRGRIWLAKENVKRGERDRPVVLPEGLHGLVREVAGVRLRHRPGGGPRALFRSRSGAPLGRKDVWRLIRKRAAEAGVPVERLSAHSFRRGMGQALNTPAAVAAAQQALGAKVDGEVLAQRALGHKDRKTTDIYLWDLTEEIAADVATGFMARKLGLVGAAEAGADEEEMMRK